MTEWSPGYAAGERAGYERARREIAQAVFDEAQRLRADDFPAGRVGIEYVNGWENAAAWIEAELSQPVVTRPEGADQHG